MIVHFPKTLLFVKTAKTAGTSLEVFLQGKLFDVEASHSQEWQVYRDGFVTPRLSSSTIPAKSLPSMLRLAARWRFNPIRARHLRNHSTPAEISVAFGEPTFAGLTKVTSVRNPFDLMVSAFFFATRGKPAPPPFSEWVLTRERPGVNSEIVRSLDKSWRVIRFEYLREDLDLLCRELNITGGGGIPRLKANYRPEEARDYRHLYDSKSKAYVEHLYGDWLTTFSYEF